MEKKYKSVFLYLLLALFLASSLSFFWDSSLRTSEFFYNYVSISFSLMLISILFVPLMPCGLYNLGLFILFTIFASFFKSESFYLLLLTFLDFYYLITVFSFCVTFFKFFSFHAVLNLNN